MVVRNVYITTTTISLYSEDNFQETMILRLMMRMIHGSKYPWSCDIRACDGAATSFV